MKEGKSKKQSQKQGKHDENDQPDKKELNKDQQANNQSDSDSETESQSGSGKTLLYLLILLLLISASAYYYFNIYAQQIAKDITKPIENTNKQKWEGDILILEDQNFEEAVQKYKYLVVYFYSPKCPHCQQFNPDYLYTVIQQTTKKSPIVFSKIDSTQNTFHSEKYHIKSIPAILFFIDGVPHEFTGSRSPQYLQEWFDYKMKPKGQELTKNHLDLFISAHEVSIVYFGQKDKKYSLYQQAISQIEDFEFAHTFQEEDRKNHQVPEECNLVIFKKFEERRNDFLGKFEVEEIKQFISVYANRAIRKLDQKITTLTFEQKQSSIYLFYDDAHKDLLPIYQTIGEEWKQKLIFTYIKKEENEPVFVKLYNHIGLYSHEIPCLVIIEKGIKKFKTTDSELDEKSIRQFIDDYFRGRLVKFLKSQLINKTNNQTVVKTLVSDNFNDNVIYNEKDVLVKFFAPWCQHSQQLEPIYIELASGLKKNENIILAEIDATENDLLYLEVESYPTLYLFKNGQKSNPILYYGDNTGPSILNFIKQHTSYPWVDFEPPKKKNSDL